MTNGASASSSASAGGTYVFGLDLKMLPKPRKLKVDDGHLPHDCKSDMFMEGMPENDCTLIPMGTH